MLRGLGVAELLQFAMANPVDLLVIAITVPAVLACLSVFFTTFMAWRRKAADLAERDG